MQAANNGAHRNRRPLPVHQSAASQEMDTGRSGGCDLDRAEAHEKLEGSREPTGTLAALRCRHAIILVRRQCHRCPPVPALRTRLSEDATPALPIRHCNGLNGQSLPVARQSCRRGVCHVCDSICLRLWRRHVPSASATSLDALLAEREVYEMN